MTPLTVCCLLVKGEYPYTPEYVRRLFVMVKRHLQRPFRFVCLTDQPNDMPDGVEPIVVEKLPDSFAFWTKLRLFDVDKDWTGRVLYLDLDSLVVAPLDPIVDFPAQFALTEDALVLERADLNTDRYGRTLVRRFNSSVMVWDAGTQQGLFTEWTPADARRLSTDQDLIGEKAMHAKGMNLAWFPRLSRIGPPETWGPDAKVILAKKPKNAEACLRFPWFEPLWGGWEAAA